MVCSFLRRSSKCVPSRLGLLSARPRPRAGGSPAGSLRRPQPRGYDNFNPFERDSVGNACDTNGKFPGETAYKDPKRADTSFAQMQADRETMEEIKKDPKMSITGKPGNWKFGWDDGLGAVP